MPVALGVSPSTAMGDFDPTSQEQSDTSGLADSPKLTAFSHWTGVSMFER